MIKTEEGMKMRIQKIEETDQRKTIEESDAMK